MSLRIAAGAAVAALLLEAAAADPVKIMPLGDSITQGDFAHNSYRRPLWFKLKEAGYEVDFVGSMTRNRLGPPPSADFDADHEGHWGWRADEILEQLPQWAAAKPDVVLVHLGVNDLFQGDTVARTLVDLRAITETLRAANPDVVVLLAKLIPNSGAVDVAPFNKELEGLAASSSEQSPVVIVDLWTGFDAGEDTYDGVHPDESGEEKMAEGWFRSLRDVLPRPATDR